MKVGRKPWIVKKRAQRLDLNLKLPHRRVVPRRAARASDLPPIDARTVGTVQSNRVDVEGFCCRIIFFNLNQKTTINKCKMIFLISHKMFANILWKIQATRSKTFVLRSKFSFLNNFLACGPINIPPNFCFRYFFGNLLLK